MPSPIINGIFTKDFPDLGRNGLGTDLIPVAVTGSNVTYKVTLSALLALYQLKLGGTGLVKSTAGTISYLADPLPGANGGTGVANTSKTITLGGNLVTSGAFATTLTVTGTTNVTLPTSGTLATTTQLAAYLPLAGGALTGTVSNTGVFTSQQGFATKFNAAAGATGAFILQTAAGTNRWIDALQIAETGSGNTGSDYYKYAYADDGSVIGSTYAMRMIRATKAVDFIGTVTAPDFIGALTGNASTASTLATTRTIWGQNFNGSANVSGAASGMTTLALSGAITGTLSSGAWYTNFASATTGELYSVVGNTGTILSVGVDNSTGSYVSGGNYAAFIRSRDAVNLVLGTNSNNYYIMASNGVQTFKTGNTPTTALTLGADQSAAFAGAMTSTLAGGGVLSNSSGGTALTYIQFTTTGGNIVVGVDGSAGGAYTGSAAYSTIIGNNSTANKPLHLATNGVVGLTVSAAQAIRFNAYGAGTLTTDASGNITATSDENLKTKIVQFTRGLADLKDISPISYHWKKSTGLDTVESYSGFSAQNVQKSIPEAVGHMKDGTLTLQERPIMATLVNAINELAELNKKLQKQLDDLKKNNNLK